MACSSSGFGARFGARFGLGFGLALGSLAFAGLVGCYTVDFDEAKPDVYYCTADNDCGQDQACQQFRCVGDIGPQVEIKLPERLTPISSDDDVLIVDYDIANFTISDSNEKVEGQGKVLISIDDSSFSTLAVTDAGATLDISAGLEPGAHRLWVQAVHGDGETVYANPGATAYTVFYVVEQTNGQDSERPQIAIVSPGPNHTHVVGEDLEVVVAVRNFDILDTAEKCDIPQGCDPWGEDPTECMPCPSPEGHAHIYMVPNYPACLGDTPVNCNGDYVLTVRPGEAISSDGLTTTSVISGDRFTEPGTITFTASLQHQNHIPYPNTEFVIFDQITFEVVE